MIELDKYKIILDTEYYKGTPLISNEEYDALFGESSTVGARLGDIPHLFPMFSLRKFYEEDGKPPFEGGISSPKLDGAAVSLLYHRGVLSKALTRGCGTKGQDILEKALELVPIAIATDMQYLQITGEVVCLKSVENSRNVASGSLNLKSIKEFKARVKPYGIRFISYNVQSMVDNVGLKETYTEDMSLLKSWGFDTVVDSDWEQYPHDGIVYRVDSNKKFNSLGFTAKHPRGAYAFKTTQKPVETKLLGVVWQCGKSGKVTPVALLDPVMIGEAEVSRATLNNMAYIESLGLEIGCIVKVIRAGEIIPTIVGRVD